MTVRGRQSPRELQWDARARGPRFTRLVTLHLSALPRLRVFGSADHSGADRTWDRAGAARERAARLKPVRCAPVANFAVRRHGHPRHLAPSLTKSAVRHCHNPTLDQAWPGFPLVER